MIWYPSKNHKDGQCDVDTDWFPADHLVEILKQFPQPESKTIRINEDVKFETETAFHHYIFGQGIPFHGVICKETLKKQSPMWILHLRKN